MSHPALVAYVVSIMSTVAPPEKLAYLPRIGPEVEETEAEMRARYEDYARDLVAVHFDPAEKPMWGGSHARMRTMEYELAIAWHESNFAKDVDKGPCSTSTKAKFVGRCDGGQSYCSLQIRLGAGKTAEGWTGQDLFDDRKKCFRAGLHLMQRSAKACSKEAPEDRMSGYTSGDCKSEAGQRRSRELWAMYKRIRARFPEPGPDSAFPLQLVPAAPSAPAANASSAGLVRLLTASAK